VPKVKLTKRQIDSIKPGDREQVFWDTEVKGFGLRVRPGGSRVFVVQYRNAAGRTRKLSLGRYGRLTPAEARSLAKQRLAEVAKGEDPAEDRSFAKTSPTIRDLAERYLTEHAAVKKKPRSAAEDRRLLEKHILPALGNTKVLAVTRADVAKLHHGLRGTPYLANRVLALASKMFALAEAWGLRPQGPNPTLGIERFKERARKRYLSGEELARLGAALAKAEQDGSESPYVVAAIRLLLFTGARRGEILSLKWSEVNFSGARINLSDSKTGEKVIYLNEPALRVLAEVPRQADNPHVIVGARPGSHLVNLQKPWTRVRARAALDDVRLHDIRHSFGAVAAASGMGLPLIGSLMGHSQPATTARYAHLADDPQRAAAEKIGQKIAEALTQEPSRKVVNLDERRMK